MSFQFNSNQLLWLKSSQHCNSRGVASCGMFVAELARRQGIGAAIIAYLIERCTKMKLRPVAGCWYYNHNSKKTLEKAGMFTQTGLLKISY